MELRRWSGSPGDARYDLLLLDGMTCVLDSSAKRSVSTKSNHPRWPKPTRVILLRWENVPALFLFLQTFRAILSSAKPLEHWLRPVHHKPVGAALIQSLMAALACIRWIMSSALFDRMITAWRYRRHDLFWLLQGQGCGSNAGRKDPRRQSAMVSQ